MQKFTVLIILAAMALLQGCASNYEGDSRSKDPRERSKVMHLYRIDLDQEAIAGGARRLFAEPPPRYRNGVRRRAQGFLGVSDSGFCRIEVYCAEPVVGLTGTNGEQQYRMLKFYGRISDDGTKATTTSGETASMRSSRNIEEILFIERGRNKITVQAVLGGKPQAYLFHFNHAAIGSKNVRIPWK